MIGLYEGRHCPICHEMTQTMMTYQKAKMNSDTFRRETLFSLIL